MQVFQTAADPPRLGSTILPTMGWTRKSKVALTKSVKAKRKSKGHLEKPRTLECGLGYGINPKCPEMFQLNLQHPGLERPAVIVPNGRRESDQQGCSSLRRFDDLVHPQAGGAVPDVGLFQV